MSAVTVGRELADLDRHALTAGYDSTYVDPDRGSHTADCLTRGVEMRFADDEHGEPLWVCTCSGDVTNPLVALLAATSGEVHGPPAPSFRRAA